MQCVYQNGGHGFGLGRKGTNVFLANRLRKIGRLPNNYTLKTDGYVFTYFKGNGEDGLHLAYSEDGYKWETLKTTLPF